MTILVLTGGVGGAKLALGLSKLVSPEDVRFLVNTADDFEHLGLHISPDLDTLTYTLANIANPRAGWGQANDSWHFMKTLEKLGEETWFQIGDKDLALHVFRMLHLNRGYSLSQVTEEITCRFGICHQILPMSDDPVRTIVLTSQGPLSFQHYFVRDRCKPHVTGFRFEGAEQACVNPKLKLNEIQGVVIAPSNPFVSVDPILATGNLKEQLQNLRVPIVAVSPIVAGAAVKGPAAKMMKELGLPATAPEIALYYSGFISGFILDKKDEHLLRDVQKLGIAANACQTIMVSLSDRISLARSTLSFMKSIS